MKPGRFRRRCVDNADVALNTVQWAGVNWIRLDRNGDHCRNCVSTVMILTFFPVQKMSCLGRRLLASTEEPCPLQLIVESTRDGRSVFWTERRTKIVGCGGVIYRNKVTAQQSCLHRGIARLKRDGTGAETRFVLSEKRMSPFKLAGAPVQSTTASRGVRISGSNARYTMFQGSVKSTGYPLLLPVSPSLPFLCITVCHHISTGLCYRPSMSRETRGK
jgi:hypothetical protein